MIGVSLSLLYNDLLLEDREFCQALLRSLLLSGALSQDQDLEADDAFLGQSTTKARVIAFTPTLIMIFSTLLCECASELSGDKKVDALAQSSLLLESSSGM